MKNLILIVFGVLFSTAVLAQSESQIISNKITSIKTFEQNLSKGIDDKYIIEELNYDSEGRIIERKEIARKGEIKLWKKYKFDANGNLIEEVSFDYEGKIKKTEKTYYTDKLRTHKEYYDSKGRMYKKKTYEYKFGK